MPQGAEKKMITIIGAGPIGIEAAIYARQAGYNVRILERHSAAHNIEQWQHVKLFSPFELNHSPLGKAILADHDVPLPDGGAYLTGREYKNRYLDPLLVHSSLKNHIFEDCEVVAVSRRGILKGDHIGDGERQKFAFTILTRSSDGSEARYDSDYVIDASGSYGNHNWLGDGGIPALGEIANAHRIQYGLPDVANARRAQYVGKTTLVIGGGHSAATSIVGLKRLIEEDPETRVIWITRNDNPLPLQPISNDVLAERERITSEANDIVNNPNVRWMQGASIAAIRFDDAAQTFSVDIESQEGEGMLAVDNIIANVGFSPDNSIYRELQVHECYASRGPMKLAAALLSESSSADCLAQTSKGPGVLKNPEPDFYIIGMKSYGKNSNFLLKIGYEQIRDVFQLISEDESLDLYQHPKTIFAEAT